jgi:hypothetical protein
MKFMPLLTVLVLTAVAATLDWLFPLATRKVLLPLAMVAGVVAALELFLLVGTWRQLVMKSSGDTWA